jgi:DNA adenine methylase
LNEQKTHKIKPFLRWAGGKTWLVKNLNDLIPKNGFNDYHEPFLGGGSVFLAINEDKRAFLSDLNSDLINTYKALKREPEGIIKALKKYKNTKDFYYKIRATQFSDEIDLAAKFIFLNQTSFNGIYRVNLKGQYNVPYGNRKKDFLEPDKLRLVSKKLTNASLRIGDFADSIHEIKENDLIFLDPPYTVSHNNNGFIKYNQKLFSLDDQYRLSKFIDEIKNKGAFYILTNAAHETIKEIFDKGDRLIEGKRVSLVGGLNAKRGETKEYIFTNITNNL